MSKLKERNNNKKTLINSNQINPGPQIGKWALTVKSESSALSNNFIFAWKNDLN